MLGVKNSQRARFCTKFVTHESIIKIVYNPTYIKLNGIIYLT